MSIARALHAAACALSCKQVLLKPCIQALHLLQLCFQVCNLSKAGLTLTCHTSQRITCRPCLVQGCLHFGLVLVSMMQHIRLMLVSAMQLILQADTGQIQYHAVVKALRPSLVLMSSSCRSA